VFVLGGFVADYVRWAAFSGEWQAALDLPPKLDYFKMSEAVAMHGQFHPSKGWAEQIRDERLDILADIVVNRVKLKKAPLYSTKISISQFVAFLRRNARWPAIIPFIFLSYQIILLTTITSDLYGINESVDFIFDETDGFSTEFRERWPAFRQIADRQARLEFGKRIGDEPF
jgi:hypothetical protein